MAHFRSPEVCHGSFAVRVRDKDDKARHPMATDPVWVCQAAFAPHTTFREQVVLPTANPSARAMLRSQSGPHACVWLSAIPADAAATLAADLMHLALRRRLRLGGDDQHGCRGVVDALSDHPTSCPRTGLLARRGFVFERAWVQQVSSNVLTKPLDFGKVMRPRCVPL